MATIKDVAKKAGVSISTVSLCMNYPERVSESTKKKVHQAMQKLAYVPGAAAKSVRESSERRQSVALITTEVSGPYFYEIMRGVSETLAMSGLEMILLSGIDAEQRHFDEMAMNPHVAGILMLGVEEPKQCDIAGAIKRGMPVVFINRHSPVPGAGSVYADNRHVGQTMAHHLLHIGYRKIAVMGNQNNERIDRARGFFETLESHGINLPESWVIPVYLDEKNGFAAMTAYLRGGMPLPEAIFCMNDEIAIGVITALKQKGISVPEQIAVVGCDDVSVSRYISPPITTVALPKFEQGMLAVTQLLRQRSGKPAEHIVLNGKLIIRDSCGYHLQMGRRDR